MPLMFDITLNIGGINNIKMLFYNKIYERMKV